MRYELALITARLIKVAVTVIYGAATAIWYIIWPLFRGMFRYTRRRK